MTVDEQLNAINDQLTDVKQQLITHVHGYTVTNLAAVQRSFTLTVR